MKELGKNEIYYKTGCCRSCIYSIYHRGMIDDFDWRCTRFPTWIDIKDVDGHWCGEWKEDSED